MSKELLMLAGNMSDRTELICRISDMLQRANARELDIIWRILRGLLGEATA